MRWLVLPLVFVIGCKKKEEPPADPTPSGPPASGHSVTKVKDDGTGTTGSGGDTGGDHSSTTAAAGGSGSAREPSGPPADAALYGGNGKPAYKDDGGHVHGPGGPIFMGHGPDCTAEIDHCMRDGVWFAVGTIRPGNMYRATPSFEFDGKWWDFNEREVECDELLKTKTTKGDDLQPGDTVVWLVEENQKFEWLNNEMDSLTSSRWEAGIIDEAASGGKFKIKGWNYAVRVDSARAVVEHKKCPNAS
jgi:hypothetical protein